MKRDFFAALSQMVALATDPDPHTAGLALATLEHCVEELTALVDAAEAQPVHFSRQPDGGWLLRAREDAAAGREVGE
jgi:hypothetical protein